MLRILSDSRSHRVPEAIACATYQLHEAVAARGFVSATTIQTVGGKGYDGFMGALVKP